MNGAGMGRVDVERIVAPALEEYSAALSDHKRDWDADGWRCSCGWRPAAQRSQARALSLHIGAAVKRAGKRYDEHAARLLEAARRGEG